MAERGMGRGLAAILTASKPEAHGAELREHFPTLVFRTVIPRNVRISEAPSYGRAVIHHDPHSSGADAYFELAKEVAERG